MSPTARRPLERTSAPPKARDALHRVLLAQLERLERWSEGDDTTRPIDGLLTLFAVTLRMHLDAERRDVLPLLLECGDGEVRSAAERLREDHAWIELRLLDLEVPSCGVDSDGGPADLRLTVRALGALVREHVALQESLCRPAARQP